MTLKLLDKLIQPRPFELAEEFFATLLIAEAFNQVTKAQESGYTPEEIEKGYKFNVAEGQFTPTNNTQVKHLANIYVHKSDTPEDDLGSTLETYYLNVDLYASIAGEIKEDSQIDYSSTLSDKRLNYLLTQVDTILTSQKAMSMYKGLTQTVEGNSPIPIIHSFRRQGVEGFMKYVRNNDENMITLPFAYGRIIYKFNVNYSKDKEFESRLINEFFINIDLEKIKQEILIK